MIDIIQKQDCCGCGACVQICPKGCMCMVEDTEGFLYPQVDKSVIHWNSLSNSWSKKVLEERI